MADYEILVGDYDTQQTTPIAISMNWGDRLEIGSGGSGNDHYAKRLSSGTNYWTNTANGSASGTGNRAFNGQNTFVYYYAHGTVGVSDTSPTALSRIEVYKEQDPNVFALWFMLDVTLSWANTTASIPSGPHADGASVNLTYTNNYGDSVKPNLSFNSTGSPPSWGSGNDLLTPGTNQTYAVTADISGKTLNSNGAYNAGIGVKLGALSGSYIAATTAQEIIYEPVVAGTPSIVNSSNDNSNGNCTFTASATGSTLWPQPATSTTGFDDFRFRIDNSASAALCTARGVPAPGTVVQAFLNGNTCTLGGEYRGIPIEVQTRVQGPYNNTGGTSYTAPVTAPIIAPDRNITVNGFSPASPATSSAFSDTLSGNTFISSGQTTETIAIAGAQVGDSIRVIKDSNNANLVAFQEITATSFNLVVPTSFAEFPGGQSELVKVQIKRTLANGGDNSNATALAFTLTRNLNQATGRLLIDQASSDITFETTTNIGATAYIAAANGSTGSDTAVDIDLSGTVSGEDYRVVVTSGTTNGGGTSFTGVTATGTTLSYFLAEGRLPNVNSTVSYKIQARDNSATGDGVWYDCFHDILGQYIPGRDADFTITRDDYVTPNLVTGPFSISGVFSTASTNTYVLGFNDTANKSWTVSSTQTTQVYKVTSGGSDYDTFSTGNSSLSGTFLNADIPITDGNTTANFFLETAVPITSNGTGIYSVCTESGGSPLVFAFLYREVPYTTPTINAISARMETSDLSKIVPYVQLTDPAGNSLAAIDFAWSTSVANPTSWFNPSGTLSMTGYHSANFSLDKFSTGSTPANYTVYFGVRARSAATGAVTTPSYTSYSVIGGNYVLDPGGGLADGYLNQENNPSAADFIQNNGEIVLESTDTLNETVSFFSLGNPAAIDTVAQSDYRNSTTSALFTSVSPRTQYFINVISGTTQGNITQVGVALLPLGDSFDTYTLSNPSELPTTGNTVRYKFYRRQLQNQGGDGTSQVPAQDALVAEWTARRRIEPDGNITVTVPKTQLTPADGNQTITIADGNSNTQYKIRVTATTDGGAAGGVPTVGTNVGDRVGNGTIILDSNDLPGEGDSVSYKVQFREQSTSDSYQDCTGTNVTFTISRTVPFELGGPFTVPISSGYTESNEVIVEGFVGTLDIALSGANTQFRVKPSGGSYGSWTNSGVTGQTISSGGTIQVRNNAASSYSTNTTANLTLDQGATTLFSDSFTITTEADPGGSSGGGGGTGGTYGLQVFDSSGNTVLNINDAVTNHASFNGALSVTVTTGNTVGTANLPTGQQGNVALILDGMNPTILQDCAEVSVSGNQVTVTTLAQRTTNKTFSVLVLDS